MWLLSTLMTGVLIIGLAVVIYSLAVGTIELVNKIRSERKYREQLAVYEQLVSDDVYYRDKYAELFSQQLEDIYAFHGGDHILVNESDYPNYIITDATRELLNTVNQFVEESKVVR